MKYPDAETLIAIFERTAWIIHHQTEGISDEESLIQPPVRGNCMNWILGHILTERNYILRLLDEDPVFDRATHERYERDSEPMTRLEDGLPFHKLMECFDESQQKIIEGLRSITEARLAEMGVADKMEDQVGALIAYIHWHETYHTGQFELLRQLAGRNDKII